MKRILSLLMVLLMMVSFGLISLPAQAAGNDAAQIELRDWFYGDPMTGIELYGQEALDKMGGMDDILLALENQDDTAGAEQDSPFMGITPRTALRTQIDMSVYDVLKFKDRSSWTKKDGAAVVSSTYQAAEYFMYGVMSGTGWQATAYTDPWGGGWDGVYYIVFTPDIDLPWEARNQILGPLGEFIYAYFPHYSFSVGSTISGYYGDGGKAYVGNVTYAIGHNPTSDADASMNWKEEWDEALALMTKDVSNILGSGNTPINSGDTAAKLKKAHDYIALKSTYTLNEQPHAGQRAYCALIEGTPVCNGYALAYSMLCLRMGLDVPYMSGDAGGPHAWNLNLTGYSSGQILLTDATWDDQPGAPGGIIYDYYNQTFDDFRSGAKKRTWNQYYESYIDFVHGKKDNLKPGLIFSNMVSSSGDNPGIPGDAVTVPSDDDGIYINLSSEKIELDGFVVEAYSTNGGTKWVKGSLPADAAKFSKLFDKEMTLWLSDTYNERDVKEGGVLVVKKGVPANAGIVKFPKINARPKPNSEKLAPVYKDAYNWWLAKKTDSAGTEVLSGYEYAPTSDGKNPSGAWNDILSGGFELIAGKTKKVYLFRSVPVGSGGVYTPGSKSFKITPANLGAAPKYKIDYKNEVIKLKNGDAYAVGGGAFVAITEANPKPLDVSVYLTAGTPIKIKKDATGKKPPTEVQEIKPQGRVALTDVTLACASGKITTSMKNYEVLDSSKNKWGGVPKVTADGTFSIRVKSTAKDTSGNAASAVGTLTIKYGVYDEEKNKSGIIAAYIGTPPDSGELEDEAPLVQDDNT